MKKAFIIVTVSNRVKELNELLESMAKYVPDFNSWDVCVFMQDNLGVKDQVKTKYVTKAYIHNELLGCNAARIALLKQPGMLEYDVYCNLDDDILLTEYTNYDPAIKKCMESGVGFVLTNWARTESLMMKKVPKMEDRFVKQALIYQGGGMLYSNKIAKLITKLPVVKTVFDEGWPLKAYLEGYENYRYLGSLAIHKICTTGGMRSFYSQTDYSKLPNLYPEYINYKMGKDGKWLIPMDADLTDKAKEVHRLNKTVRREAVCRAEEN